MPATTLRKISGMTSIFNGRIRTRSPTLLVQWAPSIGHVWVEEGELAVQDAEHHADDDECGESRWRIWSCWQSSTPAVACALGGRCLDFDPQSKVSQLSGIDRSGCFAHQIGAVLRLGECDDVADVVGAEEEHHEPIQSEGDAAMGGRRT